MIPWLLHQVFIAFEIPFGDGGICCFDVIEERLGVTLVNPVMSSSNDAMYMLSMLSVIRFLSSVSATL